MERVHEAEIWREMFTEACQRIRLWLGAEPAVQFQTKAEVNVVSPNGHAGLYIVEVKSGDLEIHLDSRVVTDAGKKLRLQIGPWRREILLAKIDKQQAGGKAVIKKAERRRLPPDVLPLVELIE